MGDDLKVLYDKIDWARMAQPQADGYDTEAILGLVAVRYPTWRKPVLDPGTPAMFGGRVPLTNKEHTAGPTLINCPMDYPRIAETDEFLRMHWPEQWEQCGRLMPELWIMLDTKFALDFDAGGCTCGDLPEFGGVLTTAQGVAGFAHGIVHELGHWKLRAMGVELLEWDNLVANELSELYESPIRKDIQRPMGACLQAHYSYLHVLEMEIRARLAGFTATMLETNYGRVVEGRRTLELWRPVPGTEAFLHAIDAWGADLLVRSEPLLRN